MKDLSDFDEKVDNRRVEKEEAIFFDREMFELKYKIETTGKDNFYYDFVFDANNLIKRLR